MRRRLADAIRRALARWCASDIVWGESDCLMALADIYRDALGVDPAAPWRGRYTTERGAMRVTGRAGVPGAIRRAARAMGWPRIRPDEAETGDLAIVRTPRGPAGVIRYRDGWIGRRDRGFARADKRLVIAAYRIA